MRRRSSSCPMPIRPIRRSSSPIAISSRGVTQAANMFHALGVGNGRRRELPAAAAAGCLRHAVRRRGRRHRQSRQSAAGAAPDRGNPGSRATPRCWWRSARCRAPTSGRRSSRSAASCKHLKAIVQVGTAPAIPPTASIRFDELIKHAAVRPAGQRPARFPAATSPPISTPAAPPARRSSCATPTPTRSTRPGRCNLMLQVEARRQSAVRHAAVPRRRLADAGAGDAVGRRLPGRAVAVGLAQSRTR